MDTKPTYLHTSYPQTSAEGNVSQAAINGSNMTINTYVHTYYPISEGVTFQKVFELYIIPVLVLIGTAGNILILVTVRQRNLSNWSICFYLGAYAVVNIFILVPMSGAEWFCKVTNIKYINNLSNLSCKLWQFLMDVVIYSGIWFVYAMLVDQYIAIWLPLRAQSMCTIFMAKFATTIIVIGLIVVSIHAIWTFELFPNGCYLFHQPNDLLTLIWPWVSLSCYCIIPLFLIIIFIVLVIYGVATQGTCKKSPSNYQVPIDITLMTIALSVTFVVFVTPATVIHITKTNLPNTWLHDVEIYRTFEIAANIGELLTYMNPTLAIFVCVGVSSTFRTELVEALRTLCCKQVIRVYEMQVNSAGNSGNEFEYCSETTPL